MEEKNNRKKGKGRTTEKKKNTAIIQFSLRISELIGKLNWGGIRRPLRRELRMAIILSNAKAMESKSDASRRPHSFPPWSPPTFRIIFFQFSPDPQANIIISDLAKLVDSFHLIICTSRVNSVFHQRRLVGKFKWKGRIIKRKEKVVQLKKLHSNTEVWDDRWIDYWGWRSFYLMRKRWNVWPWL